ncbi:Interferon-inducible GTPase 5 [Merluccius polli]|uniref:Interferon-inducible GTPase 5 n=1 Tax=Merluccius polli TaxID=89951 RepID=A0AA47MXQ7_MERPO|nr:Interferon-inducible GTPase 5 [Merluccius polli]
MGSEATEQIKKALDNNDPGLAASITKTYLEDSNNIPLNIAVTGESGCGKSTFVNAFRGIDNRDETAAPTDVVETTIDSYPHPRYPNVKLWDLPGVGTTKFPADQYLKLVGFEKLDFFIIVSAYRFRDNDAKLAQEIEKMGKKFYYIRCKIDNNLRDAERSQRKYDEGETLQEIRENCIQGLEDQGVKSPQVFLVSLFDLHMYDFPTLQETIERDMPSLKRDVLNLDLPNVCRSVIHKKKEVFSAQIKCYSILSACATAIPVPGLSIAANVGILVSGVRTYVDGFGLDKKSLEKLSSDTNTPLPDLMEVMKCDISGKDVTAELVVKMLLNYSAVAAVLTATLSLIPIVGALIASPLSYRIINRFLSDTLDKLFAQGLQLKQLAMITDGIAASSRTLTRMAKVLRKVCIAAVKRLRKRWMRIGGRHRFVVIDESKFAHKRKYHRGRCGNTWRRERQWVFGMLEVDRKSRRPILRLVRDRRRKTLIDAMSDPEHPSSVMNGVPTKGNLPSMGMIIILSAIKTTLSTERLVLILSILSVHESYKLEVWRHRGNRTPESLKLHLKMIEWHHWLGVHHYNGYLRVVMKCVFSGKDVTKALVVLLLRCLPLFGMWEAAEEGLGSIPTLGSIIAASLSFLTVYTFSSSALHSLSVDAEHVQIKALNIQCPMESKATEEIKKALDNKDLGLAASITKKYLEDINNVPLNIAVTGESGSGKSTFVNALRGTDNRDETAAPTGVKETTKEPESYPHPRYQNVILWDLPGIGTTKFPADQYLKLVGFERFDFFIIVSADRFTENDAKLAQEIKKMGKKFYFIRPKIDNNLHAAERSQRKYDEGETLQEIRENCIKGLVDQGVSPQVFMVSLFDLHKYDFQTLLETIEREMPSLKRDVLILAVPVCRSFIHKKKEVFSSRIKYYALLSAGAAAVPVPGLSFPVDAVILVSVLTTYVDGFGLDKKSLEKLSSDTKMPLAELMEVMKCPLSGKDVTEEVVVQMLSMLPAEATGFWSWIPFFGALISAPNSSITINGFLSDTLDSLFVDAENVLTAALGN